MKWISKLFCRHQYQQIGFREAYSDGIRYSVRKYKCEKCGKECWVDGRYDNIERSNT